MSFVFISCDSLVHEEIPEPSENWMAYAEITGDLKQYRTVKVESNKVTKLLEKGESDSNIFPYYKILLKDPRDFCL